MHFQRTKIAIFVLLLALPISAPRLLAKKKDKIQSSLNGQQRALQALNRLTFGPRPGDVQQVMAMGVQKWMDLQLHPEKINDSALESRLQPFSTLRMSTKEIAEEFPDQQEIKQVRNGKLPMPSDPERRAIYEVQLARLEERKERKEALSTNSAATTNSAAMKMDADTSAPLVPAEKSFDEKEEARLHQQDQANKFDISGLASLAPDERYSAILAMPTEELVPLADSLRVEKTQDLLQGMTIAQKEVLFAMKNPPAVVDSELAQAKLLRAIYSQRQLEEVMTDFWLNHFNVFVGKGLDRMMLTSYERDVIRPHSLGKFEDLLVATAKSPAMLFYLDNWLSVGPDSAQALGRPPHPNGGRPRPNQGKRQSGLNENYGRELLELHTLSVNGGYTQQDVAEVAKVFTGWTIDKPAQGGGFKFEARMHEPGDKMFLGHRIKDSGENEGVEVLHLLATSPKTAHFISLKLAQRFVADDPPPALVDKMAKTFLKKKGDIREVLSVVFHSPEFWSDSTYLAKVKTPLEFVASTIRATGADVEDALPLTQQLNRMGMPLYGAQPPTGYSMKAGTWVSSSALLNRMNFALAVTGGKVKGVGVQTAQLAGNTSSDFSSLLAELESNLIPGGVSPQTHESILGQFQIGQPNAGQNQVVQTNARQTFVAPTAVEKNSGQQENKTAAFQPAAAILPAQINTMEGLLLGSPEFQKR